MINNPSNPCGSNFSKEHLAKILEVADEIKVPIISDEVYFGLAYEDGAEYFSLAHIPSDVPIICINSISKIYCLPGWRLGWSIVYNRHGYFNKVIDHLHKHNQINLHPTSLVQKALPRILKEVGDDYFTGLKQKLKEASHNAYEQLSGIRGLEPVKASAAMYMMVRIKLDEFADIENDLDFCKKLLQEECVLTFPAQSFFSKDAFRVVICQSHASIAEAA